jgi:hypothetical protein
MPPAGGDAKHKSDTREGQPRRRRLLLSLLVAGAALLVAVAGLEGLLRAYPTLLGQAFANGALSKYTTREGGIYYRDRALRIHFMIPNLTTQMYANGHVWLHQTDALGFRNRGSVVPADVILLGDSYIYGHGVSYEDTVGNQLHQMTGLVVANLARQGDCIFQEAYLLTEYLPLLRARWIVYFFYENDIADLYAFVSEQQMEEFIATPFDAIRYPARRDPGEALQARQEAIARRSVLQKARDRLYVYKMLRWLRWRVGLREAVAAPGRSDMDPADGRSVAWRYTRHAIGYMKFLSDRAGAQLMVGAITPGNRRQYDLVQDIAREYGLPFLDTSAFTAADATLWLPGDGHPSPAGARRLAALVAAQVRAPTRQKQARQ